MTDTATDLFSDFHGLDCGYEYMFLESAWSCSILGSITYICVIMGTFPGLSGPQFPHLKSELILVKFLEHTQLTENA